VEGGGKLPVAGQSRRWSSDSRLAAARVQSRLPAFPGWLPGRAAFRGAGCPGGCTVFRAPAREGLAVFQIFSVQYVKGFLTATQREQEEVVFSPMVFPSSSCRGDQDTCRNKKKGRPNQG